MENRWLLIPICFVIVISFCQAQNSGWTITHPFEQKVFIENKGQFDESDNQQGSDIQYVVDNLGTRIFFTKKGLTYRFNKAEKKAESSDNENKKTDPDKDLFLTPVFVHMHWLEANYNVQIEVENEVSDYYTYTDTKRTNETIVARAYQKLTYKNLYPGIDVVYTFPDKDGIKYAIVIHPGADASAIKMAYSADEKTFTDKGGNIHLVTEVGDIIDHTPTTYYLENMRPIISSFIQKGDEVDFSLANTDKTKTVVIDPWTTNPSFMGRNAGWDIDKDAAGNIYCSGGGNPYYLKKYNSTGTTLLWTFTNPNNTNWNGDHVTDKNGNSYIGCGAWLGTSICKINTAGTLVWNNTAASAKYTTGETWRLALNCKTDSVYGAGFDDSDGVVKIHTNLYSVNTGNGTFNNNIHADTNDVEIRSITIDPIDGSIYAIAVPLTGYTATSIGNRLVKIALNFSVAFDVNDGYSLTEIQTTYNPNDYGGFNGVAVGCYLYTYDGDSLIRWDKTTGAQIGAVVTVPGGTNYENSGLLVDECGNVYAGSSSAIYKYDYNLNLITHVNTPGTVYDLALGNNSGEILACGSGFISSINMGLCTAPNISFSTTPAGCNLCNGTATALINGCDSAFTYLWEPSGGTGPNATNLCSGLYTIIISDTGHCYINSVVDTAIIGNGGASVSVNSPTICSGNSAQLIATGAQNHTWSPGNGLSATTGDSIIANPTATTTYTIIGTNSGCADTVLAIVSVTPSIPLGIKPQSPSVCSGQSITLNAPVSGSGYTWAPSATLSSSTGDTVVATPLTQTTYTVTGTDSLGCNSTGIDIVSIIPASPLIIQPPSPQTLCLGQSIVLSVPVSGNDYIWSPSATLSKSIGDTVVATPIDDITYTVTGTDSLGCMASDSEIIFVGKGPSKPTITTNGDILTSSATQGNQWVRNDTTLQGATDQNYTATISGWYKVIVENPANGCSTTADSVYISVEGIGQVSMNGGSLIVYPNPTSGEIIVNICSSIGEINSWNLQITDVLGRTVYTKRSLDYYNKIDLSNLSNGVYFISVFNKTGRTIIPIVKQN